MRLNSLVLLLLAFIGFGLMSCGSSEAPETATSVATPSAPAQFVALEVSELRSILEENARLKASLAAQGELDSLKRANDSLELANRFQYLEGENSALRLTVENCCGCNGSKSSGTTNRTRSVTRAPQPAQRDWEPRGTAATPNTSNITVSPVISPNFYNGWNGNRDKGKRSNAGPELYDAPGPRLGGTVTVTDTVTKRLLPFGIEGQGGFHGEGPVGGLRFTSPRIEFGGFGMWNERTETADILVDGVVRVGKLSNDGHLRLGAAGHVEIAPSRWVIPSQERTVNTFQTSAGAVTHTRDFTRDVNVTNWATSQTNVGPVVGYERDFRMFGGQWNAYADVIPMVSTKGLSLKSLKDPILNGRGGLGLYLDKDKTDRFGVTGGILDGQLYPAMTLKIQ